MGMAAEPGAIPADALQRATSHVRWRLLPFLIVCYFAAYLDRVNIGFAALTMNAELGIGPQAFGFIAGIFFLGYCLFEVPSNVILARVGAGAWIARIMITWGVISAATALATDVTSLAVLRFLLGVAEAGFFPGIIFYLTRWVPAAERGAVISIFMAAVPISNVIGAPLSGLILNHFDGVSGLKGWQWLFILEALPSIVLGVLAYRWLEDSPSTATWLTADEKAALSQRMAQDADAASERSHMTLREALTNGRVIGLGFAYFGIACGMYGLTFWLPQIVKAFGFDVVTTGFVTALPFAVAVIAMVLWGRLSDARADMSANPQWSRARDIALPCFVASLAMIAGTLISDPGIALAVLVIVAVGVFTALPTFWTLPTALLSGVAAAGGIALINSIGNAGGFAGPYIMGWIKERGFGNEAAIASLAFFLFMSGVLVLLLSRKVRD